MDQLFSHFVFHFQSFPVLRCYPKMDDAELLSFGFKYGFKLHYEGSRRLIETKNLKSVMPILLVRLNRSLFCTVLTDRLTWLFLKVLHKTEGCIPLHFKHTCLYLQFKIFQIKVYRFNVWKLGFTPISTVELDKVLRCYPKMDDAELLSFGFKYGFKLQGYCFVPP
jgi:hypothetical protein